MCWADWNNAWNKILTKMLAKNFIFKTEDDVVPLGKLKKKIWKKNFFCILKIHEERSWIRIRTRMSRIPNTGSLESILGLLKSLKFWLRLSGLTTTGRRRHWSCRRAGSARTSSFTSSRLGNLKYSHSRILFGIVCRLFPTRFEPVKYIL